MSYPNKEVFVEILKQRTKKIALDSVRVYRQLPKIEEARIIGLQFLRSSTSIAANYRAVCRARSKAEFFSKLSIAVEETDETLFWLEVMRESELLTPTTVQALEQEVTEVLKLFSKARKNTY